MAKLKKTMKAIDGNTAAAHASYALTEVAAIYPITPSSTMGELTDEWSAYGLKNIFNREVIVSEMQSEAGAAGAVHGSLSAGSLTTTYTASQGLLLMIPNLYKLAGELLPGVFHVTARTVASHALSIFGDHSDVMAVRQTGALLLASNSVQEAMDLGLVAHLSAIRASLPVVHFFDGFRTSHEVLKVEMIDYEDIKKIVDYDAIAAFKDRGMRPEVPVLKGTAQNPDVFFQAREACNPYYDAAPAVVQEQMDKVYEITGRRYHLFDYVGHPEADRVIIAMGSGCETIEETICYLMGKGEKVGVVKVHLYRPFSVDHFLQALPGTVRSIAVLDRTKEPGSEGEPLYKDVVTALYEKKENITVVGGRYGLSSKEFTPGMVMAVFDNLKGKAPKNQFTVGINDDVTHTSLRVEKEIDTTMEGTVQCKFWGFGSDGTVGANKDAIKIIGDNTDMYAQGYFAYDSKKSGGLTVSHLRFGKHPIRSTYLIRSADYIACHKQSYVTQYDLLDGLKENGTFVLNTTWTEKEIEEKLPASLKRAIAAKKAKFYIIDAVDMADKIGLGQRINMIMQTVFFKLSAVVPFEDAVSYMKKAIEKTYGKKGEDVVKMNFKAVDNALEGLKEIKYAKSWIEASDKAYEAITVHEEYTSEEEISFVNDVMKPMLAQNGDGLPVSAFNPDGSFPTATTRFEKRGIANKLPKWVAEKCIQCNFCALVCPHAAIRPILLTPEEKEHAPGKFVTIKPKNKALEGFDFKIQLYPMDCAGCGNCADICPGKALEMVAFEEIAHDEAINNQFSNSIPVRDSLLPKDTITGSQFVKPLFEFSGACAGCGETPYIKLATQLFGDRMVIANATGCSSIYGGSAPSCPYTVNENGMGPAWANSLFEDNAEYGYGMAIAIRQKREALAALMTEAMELPISDALKKGMKEWLENMNDGEATKSIAHKLEHLLEEEELESDLLDEIYNMKDYFIKKSVWIIGGDGWAYDIGFGGLDHVIASGEDVNILVLDTEVYSNTGGQSSKSTPFGAVAKFATSGKKMRKKDLGLIAMSYGYAYVASVSMGANYNQLLKAMLEAERYNGPSLILAYSPCINHGLDMGHSQKEGKLVVETGMWPLYTYNPTLKDEGKNAFVLQSGEPKKDVIEVINNETRFKALEKSFPGEAKKLHEMLRNDLKERYARLKRFADYGI